MAAKHAKERTFTRFDVILVFILTFAVAVIAGNAWLIVNGYEQMSAAVWTFAGTLTGGEIVAFSLYQITKEVAGGKRTDAKVLAAKHAYVDQLQKEEQDGQ